MSVQRVRRETPTRAAICRPFNPRAVSSMTWPRLTSTCALRVNLGVAGIVRYLPFYPSIGVFGLIIHPPQPVSRPRSLPHCAMPVSRCMISPGMNAWGHAYIHGIWKVHVRMTRG